MCFYLSSSAFAFLIEMVFSFKSLLAIWLLSPQWFHYYFDLKCSFLAVSERLNNSDTCAVPSVCNTVGLLIFNVTQALPRLYLSWAADDNGIVSCLHIHLFSKGFHRCLCVSPMYLLIVGLLCRSLRICVAHAPPESCPSFLLVHLAFRARGRMAKWLTRIIEHYTS